METSSSHTSKYFDPDMQDDHSKTHDVFDEFFEDGPLTSQPVIFDFAFGDHSPAAVYKRKNSQSSSQKKQASRVQFPLK